jgi:hypothetical protein
MGQAMPLPHQIPRPSNEDRKEMEAWGFTFEATDEPYITFTLPDGWTFIEAPDSSRSFPSWLFLDLDGRKRAEVEGVWKGSYDNELRICVLGEPWEKHVPTQAPSAEESLIKAYETAAKRYNAAIEAVRATGPDGQPGLDKVYQTLHEAWLALPDAKKNTSEQPRRHILSSSRHEPY